MADPHAYLASLQPLAMRLGLERMERALEALGHPERSLRILHVAGTNGKGSTCAMAAQALQDAGHRTGLYTSPHLVRFNERIALGGEPVSDATLEHLEGEVRRACPWHDGASEGERLTYFEFATLMALQHFAQEGADAVILEVGLGGRFDATNAVRPLACAIARIGLDHTEMLGDTLAAIAREKAGILKRDVPAVVTDAQPPEALAALQDEALRRGASLHVVPARYAGAIALPGPHQEENAALAEAALELLDRAGVSVPAAARRTGIATARWPGRLETIDGVLLDGAHNPDGAAALATALGTLYPDVPVEVVFGVLGDKDHRTMLRVLAPRIRALHLVPPRTPRARPTNTYAALAGSLVGRVDEHATVSAALAHARAEASDGALVCVAGSLYLVGEARAVLQSGALAAP